MFIRAKVRRVDNTKLDPVVFSEDAIIRLDPNATAYIFEKEPGLLVLLTGRETLELEQSMDFIADQLGLPFAEQVEKNWLSSRPKGDVE